MIQCPELGLASGGCFDLRAGRFTNITEFELGSRFHQEITGAKPECMNCRFANNELSRQSCGDHEMCTKYCMYESA